MSADSDEHDAWLAARVAHDGSRIAVSDAERLFVVETAAGAVRQLDAGANFGSLQFDRGGELLFGAVGETLQVWDLAT